MSRSDPPTFLGTSSAWAPDEPFRRLIFLLSRNVTRTRQQRGLTQLQLAEAAGLSRATIHLIEGGIGDPRLSTIVRLADALQIDTMSLLTDGSNDSPSEGK